MEENTKQQQLTFEKGITNIPSDAICSDNTLCESIGMVYDNGEHRVIQKPVVHLGNVSGKLIYVHNSAGSERYILLNNLALEWRVKNGSNNQFPEWSGTDDNVSATSVGNTLIIKKGTGDIYYYLWKENAYVHIGAIPEPIIEFDIYKDDNCLASHGSAPAGFNGDGLADDGQVDYNNWAIGLYSKNLKEIAQKKGFCRPFMVRAALKLYDDSYTHITQPFLMLPCIRENSYGGYGNVKSAVHTSYGKLRYMQRQDYSDWSDIVKDITIFITKGVSPYDTTKDLSPQFGFTASEPYTDGIWKTASEPYMTFKTDVIHSSVISNKFRPFKNTDGTEYHKTDKEIIDELKAQSVFYKLCDIGIVIENGWTEVDKFVEAHVLENIEVQDQLPYDDYFSRSNLSAKAMFAYNRRLNLANVSRSIFGGYYLFMPYESTQYLFSYRIIVRIRTESGTKFAVCTKETKYILGYYFYYPDSRADHVWIYKDNTLIVSAKLEEHSGLNAAFYMKELPDAQHETPSVDTDSEVLPQDLPSTPELLENTIITSEVDNPFLFKKDGYNKVGTGEIIGISTTTMALAQDNFGKTDMIVFTKNGIWGMTVDSTGLFSFIHPTSRDVCNSPQTITQVDKAVFFSSEKGLMVISESGVRCVSEQLAGKDISFVFDDEELTQSLGNFHDYLKDSFIAYDYRDSLLWIVNPNYDACYVYSIKSETFGKFALDAMVTGVTNVYPDYLIQENNTLYSLLDRDNINIDDNAYNASIITRPMKLENGLALKSIRQAVHIRQFDSDTYSYVENHEGVHVPVTKDKLQLYIYASNNLKDWARLDSLRGAPFKYFRFRYEFTGLNATDRFAGTVIITQETRTNKLR